MTRISRLILWWLKRHETQACLILDAFEEWQKAALAPPSAWFLDLVERTKREDPDYIEQLKREYLGETGRKT
jgi:hypothetical protein